jgi:uncharacterized protein (AIM24 family)
VKLLLAILRVLTRKAVAVAVLAGVLVLATFVWNWARAQTRTARAVAEAQARVETGLQEWRARKADLLQFEAQLVALQGQEPSWFSPVERLKWQARVAAAEAAVESARALRDQAHATWDDAKSRLATVQQQVDRTWAGLLAAARSTGWQIVAVAALVLGGPLVWKAFWYYGLAALASRRPPAQLGQPQAAGRLTVGEQAKALEVPLRPGAPLLARMDWVQQYSPGLSKRTRFLFEWRSPFTSYAAGLAEMTELTAGGAGVPPGTVLLNAADDPNAYLLALELDDHPGVVLKPGAVVAVCGPIHLRPRWHLRSLHHWIAGRVRHILFVGTGTVYVTGTGGVALCGGSAPVIVEEALVLGYDSRTAFATVRTETFWPYFRDKTSLFDYRFEGGHGAIRQTALAANARRNANPFVRTVDAVLNGVGKLLGF